MPQGIFVLFLCPMAVPWHESGQFLTSFSLPPLLHSLPVPPGMGVRTPEVSSPNFFLLQCASGQDVSMPHWMEVRAWLWQC